MVRNSHPLAVVQEDKKNLYNELGILLPIEICTILGKIHQKYMNQSIIPLEHMIHFHVFSNNIRVLQRSLDLSYKENF